MIITKHAAQRTKERCGIPKKSAERIAMIAFENGISHKECNGKLRRYIDKIFLTYNKGANIRIYNNHIYIFTTNGTLITVLTLPSEFSGTVNKLMKKKRC